MARRGVFGSIESRRSKTTNTVVGVRARYPGPDGTRYSRTFGDRLSAQLWLVEERQLIDRGEWRPPGADLILDGTLTQGQEFALREKAT